MDDLAPTSVYSSGSILLQESEVQQMHALCELLEETGIRSRIVGEPLRQAMGEVGFPPVQICVPRRDAERARAVIAGWLARPKDIPPASQEAWHCQQCGEEVEGGFDICWNCQSPRI